MQQATPSSYGTAKHAVAPGPAEHSSRKVAVLYTAAMLVTVLAIAGAGAVTERLTTQQLAQVVVPSATTELRQSHHLTAKLLEQGAELETQSKSEQKAEVLDLHTEKSIMKAKEDRKDSALKLNKAKELMEAAHNESLLSKQAGVQGHYFDHSVLSEHAQLNQVKQDIKAVKRKYAMAELAAQRSHKILMTSVGLSTRQQKSVTSNKQQVFVLKEQAARATAKAKALREKASKMEIRKGSPQQMIQDVEVAKIRHQAKHEDKKARELLAHAANVDKEISLLSPSAKKDRTQGDDLRERYTKKLRVAQYYADKVKALMAQKRKVEKLFDAHMNDGSSLLARASSSSTNALKLRREAERLQQEGVAEAKDADKQEAIARKFRDAAMRLRVGALAQKQAAVMKVQAKARMQAKAAKGNSH